MYESLPDFFPSIICSTCSAPLRTCLECVRQEWWFLYCPKPHCKQAQQNDYDHKHEDTPDDGRNFSPGERRYRWASARAKERVTREPQRADGEGSIRIRIYAVDEVSRRRHKVGNMQRCITVKIGRVSEIAAAIEAALFEEYPPA